MSLLYNIGDWFTLGSNSYRKVELYQLLWENFSLDLENVQIVAAPFAGPIAVVRDAKQTSKSAATPKPTIYIFTCSGKLISNFTWNSGHLRTLGWTDSEELLCVQDDGVVLIYNIFGQYLHKFSMGQEANDTKIIDAKIFPTSQGTGCAVMTTHFRIFIINSYKDPKVRLLPEIPKSSFDPTSWCVVVEERKTACLIVRDQDVFKVKQDESICTALGISFKNDFKAIRHCSVSFNGRHIAFCTNTGIIWMGTSDLKTKFCEFDTHRTEMPKQIEWCADPENPLEADALVVVYPSILLIIGINGDSNIFTYDSSTISLVAEMDGVRVISTDSHELIQKVPKCVGNIFGISISEPSSFLFESHRKYCERSHQSDEYLCLILDKIDIAVSECISAAGYEYDRDTQKSLIRAAQFGKGFIKDYSPNSYIQMCKTLRVLNALRSDDIGIPLTQTQLNHLSPTVVLDRLVFRKQYGLAIEIAKHLNLAESRILEHWAFHKISHETNDNEIIQKIAEKFRDPSKMGISFCKIAKKAEEVGKTKLAIKLLELEPDQTLQVPLLLQLNENKKALLAATQSGDTELIYLVLMTLKDTTPLSKFQMIIREFPQALNLYKKHCQLNNTTALKDIFLQEDDFLSQAEISLAESKDSQIKLESSLIEITNNYKRAHKDVESELADDHRKLMKQQKSFEEKYSREFYGLPLHDTVKELLILGDIKSAEKIRNDYKMSDKHFWYLRIEILSSHYQWEELEKFSKSKKSPIGYEPFVDVCLKARNVNEAKKYITKCRDDRKILWYNRAGFYEEAAKLAYELRDMQSLLNIFTLASTTTNRALIATIENYIAAVSSKK